MGEFLWPFLFWNVFILIGYHILTIVQGIIKFKKRFVQKYDWAFSLQNFLFKLLVLQKRKWWQWSGLLKPWCLTSDKSLGLCALLPLGLWFLCEITSFSISPLLAGLGFCPRGVYKTQTWHLTNHWMIHFYFQLPFMHCGLWYLLFCLCFVLSSFFF